MGDGRGEEQKQNTATRMLWEAVHPVSGTLNRKRRFHNTVLLLSPRLHSQPQARQESLIKVLLLHYESAEFGGGFQAVLRVYYGQ